MNQQIPEYRSYCFNPGCHGRQAQPGKQACSHCGASLWLADRYAAIRLLGQGTQRRTFLAADQIASPPRLCVVKQLWGEALQEYPTQQYPLLVQQGLGHNPHLPRDLGQLNQNGIDYRLQEYIPGENLASILAEKGGLSVDGIWQLLAQLLPALQQLHRGNIIHGDIKPENIIDRLPLDSSSQQLGVHHWVLVDVGSAQALPLTLVPSTGSSTRGSGSSAYAPPEQLNGKPQFASDLYSLGVTCIHLLTGIHPFSFMDSTDRQWLWQNEALLDTQSGLEQPLVQFLDRLTHPDLQQRIGSTEVALTEMQKLRGQRIVPTPIPNRAPPWTCYATLVGHSGLFANINAVAIAPDGILLASASDDKTIRLWEMATGQARAVLRGHTHFVKSIAFHPRNPNLLASGGRDRPIHLWDLQTQAIVQTLIGHDHAINALRFSPEGTRLASGSADKTIKLWDPQTGHCLTTLKGHRLGVTALAWGSLADNSDNRTLLASASADSTIRLWDLSTGESIATLTGHMAAVRAIAFSPDGTWLATGGEDRTIRIWEVSSWRCLHILTGHPWDISALVVTDDGKTLISSSWDKTLKLWQIDSGQNTGTLIEHGDSVSCIAIAPDQQRMVSGSYDTTLKLWQWTSK